jgi:uncharacterized paraquat-inducible protein A
MKITQYAEPSGFTSPLYWGHTVQCHHCGLKFTAVGLDARDTLTCPKCFTVERDVAGMVERWRQQVAK